MSENISENLLDSCGRPTGRRPWWLRAEPWDLLLLALFVFCGYVWLYRLPTVSMIAYSYYRDFCVGLSLFGLIAAIRLVQINVKKNYMLRLRILQQGRRPFWPLFLVIVGGTYFSIWSRAPMYLSFIISRSGLDGIADQALADPANARSLAGHWAGLYRVDGVEIINHTVVIYIGKDGGNYGFARVPGAQVDDIFNMPGDEESPNFCQDFPASAGRKDPNGRRIMGDWFMMYSSYWAVKVGWS